MSIEKYTIKGTTLKDIADAVRTKRAFDKYIPVNELANEILKIQSTEQEPPYDVRTYDEQGNVLTALYVGVKKLAAYHHVDNIKIQSVTADEVLEEIGDYCFRGDSALAKIDATGIKKIGESAFSGCSALSEIDLWAVKEIGEHAFEGCIALTIKSVPELVAVNAYAFTGANVESLRLSQCKEIKDNGFNGLSGLTSLDVPLVEKIGNYAFEGCTSIKEFYFPRVISIGNTRLFRYCVLDKVTFEILTNVPYNTNASSSIFYQSSIDILDLGREITYIANRVFTNMTKKPRVLIIRNENVLCELQGTRDFEFYDEDPENPPMILVPQSMVEEYRVATNWSAFADLIEAGEDYPEYWEV